MFNWTMGDITTWTEWMSRYEIHKRKVRVKAQEPFEGKKMYRKKKEQHKLYRVES